MATGGNFLKNERVILIAVFALALGLRLTNLNATSLWIDEIYSMMVANGHLPPLHLDGLPHTAADYYQQYLAWQSLQFSTLIALLKINVHMPLYYVLLNPWLGWFGNDAVALRSFSALWSALLIFPVYFLGKALGGKRAACLSALVIAVAPFQIYYGQEGRMYALSLFWAGLSALSLWKTLYARKPLGWSLLYALSATGGFFSHYIFVFFLGFQALYALLWLACQWRRSAVLSTPVKTSENPEHSENLENAANPPNPKRFWLLGFAAIALAMAGASWFPVYQAQQQGINEEYHFAKGLVAPLRYLTVLVWQPLVTIAGDNRLLRLFYMPLVAILFALSCLKQVAERMKPRSAKDMNALSGAQAKDARGDVSAPPLDAFSNWLQRDGFLALWIFVPLLLQIGYDVLKHTHTSVIDRYAMLISPAMCLWMGLALNRLFHWRDVPVSGESPDVGALSRFSKIAAFAFPRKAGLLTLSLMTGLAVAMVGSPSPFRDEHNKDKNIRGKIHAMAAQAGPHDLIFANGPFGVPNLLAYYLVKEPPPATHAGREIAQTPPEEASPPTQTHAQNYEKGQKAESATTSNITTSKKTQRLQSASILPPSATLPIVYWISEYRGEPVPLPSPSVFQGVERAWLFRYRSNNERGLQQAKDYLQAMYPHLTRPDDWFLYTPD